MNRVKKEAQKRRYVNTPNGRVDLHGGKPMSFDEWSRRASRANPLDRYAADLRRFEEPETPLEGLLLFREAGQYVLINRSGRKIQSLTYETIVADDIHRPLSDVSIYRLREIPAGCYVNLHDAEPTPQRRIPVFLTEVAWAADAPWTGHEKLSVWTPTRIGTRLERIPETQHSAEPERIGTRSLDRGAQ